MERQTRITPSVCSVLLAPLDLRAVLATLERGKIRGVELLGEPDLYDLDLTTALLEDVGTRVTGLTAACRLATGRDLSSPEPHARARALSHFKACIAFASAVEAPVVALAPAAIGRFSRIGTREEEWNLAVAGLRQLEAVAEAAGVAIALEVLNRYVAPEVTTVTRALELIDDADINCGVVVDLFHAGIEERSVADAIIEAGSYLRGVQVADSNRQAPGKGHFDFESIAGALAEVKYSGAMALEAYPPHCGAQPVVESKDLHAVRADIFAYRGWLAELPLEIAT